MEKIMIIGCPGGGKSTFARALHDITGIALHHLDMLYWNPDRTIVPGEVFREEQQRIINGEEWIIDGNYGSTMELRLKACDTAFFLDYPPEVCLEGARGRRGVPRLDMPWYEKADEPEDAEFMSFIQNFGEINRPIILELLGKYPDKNIVVFHSREEADDYLHRLRCARG